MLPPELVAALSQADEAELRERVMNALSVIHDNVGDEDSDDVVQQVTAQLLPSAREFDLLANQVLKRSTPGLCIITEGSGV